MAEAAAEATGAPGDAATRHVKALKEADDWRKAAVQAQQDAANYREALKKQSGSILDKATKKTKKRGKKKAAE